MSHPLLRIVYISREAQRFSPLDLQGLLVSSRASNAAGDITGLLLYKHGNFMQVIEGPSATVDALFNKIQQDRRHDRVLELARDEIHSRDFSDWTMAFRDLESEPIAELHGYSWFLHDPWENIDRSSYSDRIRSLLSVFARATNSP
jgi:hypothetical protein